MTGRCLASRSMVRLGVSPGQCLLQALYHLGVHPELPSAGTFRTTWLSLRHRADQEASCRDQEPQATAWAPLMRSHTGD